MIRNSKKPKKDEILRPQYDALRQMSILQLRFTPNTLLIPRVQTNFTDVKITMPRETLENFA